VSLGLWQFAIWGVVIGATADKVTFQVGNEFSSVEALWSSFENVMAKDPDANAEGNAGEEGRSEVEGDEETELPEHKNQ
jgi:hypothetical protein